MISLKYIIKTNWYERRIMSLWCPLIQISPPTEAMFLAQSTLSHLQPLYPVRQMITSRNYEKKKKKHWQLGLVLGDLPWDSSLSKYLYGGQSAAGQLACLCPSLGSSASAEQGEPGMKSKDFIATVSQESLRLLGIKREVTPVSPVGGGGAAAPSQREYQPERWNVGLVEGPWGEVCSQHQPGSSPAPTAPKRHALWGGKKRQH